jgi:hypothetical protein
MVAHLYTKEVAKKLREVTPPYPNIRYEIVDMGDWLAVRVFEKQIMEFEVDQRVNIMEYLEKLRSLIESYGIKCDVTGVRY